MAFESKTIDEQWRKGGYKTLRTETPFVLITQVVTDNILIERISIRDNMIEFLENVGATLSTSTTAKIVNEIKNYTKYYIEPYKNN